MAKISTAELPKLLKVGYQDITVIPGEFNLEGDLGAYQDEEGRIYVNTGKGNIETVNTLIHELLHAICFTYGLRENDAFKGVEEQVCTVFANGITQALKDNPKLLTFLKDSLCGNL